MHTKKLYAISVLAIGALLSGCGGGGGTTSSLPSVPAGGGITKAPSAAAKLVITVPAAVTQSGARAPKYVSSNTQSVSIVETDGGGTPLPPVVANLTPGSPNCTTGASGTTCTVTVPANPGSDSFAVTTFDAVNATGHQLSTGSLTATIVSGQANTTVPVVLGGIVATILPVLADAFAPIGSSGTNLNVQAKDASGATIIGTYDNPIALSAGAGVTLGYASVTNSNDASHVGVAYAGEPSAPITITATGDGHTGTATLTPGSGIAYYNVGNTPQFDNGGFMMATGADGKLYYGSIAACTVPTGGGLCSANYGAIAQFDPVTKTFAEYHFTSSQVTGVYETADGAIWALESTSGHRMVARFAPGTFPNAPVEVPVPGGNTPRSFALSPDGHSLWFSSFSAVNKIDLTVPFSSAAITMYGPITVGTKQTFMQGIAWGADGNLYAADFRNGNVTVISPAGAVLHQYPNADHIGTRFVAAGSDGNIYATLGSNIFTYPSNGGLRKMTTGGVYSNVNMPAAALQYEPDAIAASANSLWWADLGDSSIGSYNLTTGSVRELPAGDYLSNQTIGRGANGVTFAPDGSAWFTCYGNTGGLVPLCLGHVVLNTTWSVLPQRSVNVYGAGPQSAFLMGIAESGDSGPFTVTSSNASVASAANVSDHNFSIVGAGAGNAVLTVTDAHGRSVTVNVSVTISTGTVQSVHRQTQTSGGLN